MTFRIIKLKPTGTQLGFVSRTCCGPDGVGPCISRTKHDLPCGIGEVPTYEPHAALRERAEYFRRLRIGLGLSYRTAAERLGVSIVDVSAIEMARAHVKGWNELLEQLSRNGRHDAAMEDQTVSLDTERYTLTAEQMRALSMWATEMHGFFESGHAVEGKPSVHVTEALGAAYRVAAAVRGAFVFDAPPAPRKVSLTPVREGAELKTLSDDVFGYVLAPNAVLDRDIEVTRDTREGIVATITLRLLKGTIVEKPTLENLRSRLFFAAVHHLRAAGVKNMEPVIDQVLGGGSTFSRAVIDDLKKTLEPRPFEPQMRDFEGAYPAELSHEWVEPDAAFVASVVDIHLEDDEPATTLEQLRPEPRRSNRARLLAFLRETIGKEPFKLFKAR